MKNISFQIRDNASLYEITLFKENFRGGDLYCNETKIMVDAITHDILQTAKDIVNNIFPNEARIEAISNDAFIIRSENKMMVIIKTDAQDVFGKQKSKLSAVCYGAPSESNQFKKELQKAIPDCGSPGIEWHYMSQGYRENTTIFLEERPVIHKEYYPWFSETPNDYADRFMKSKCGLLILRGEPGTGKTSFIRNLLWHCKAKAMITYEEELFKSDDMFAEFLSGKNNVMIMEDADAFLESRVRTGNTTMTKFLNVSDGIIDLPNKKLIVSANTIDNTKIDDALLRPGRCFDAPIFRRLTYDETVLACDASGKPRPTENRSYSLAEMFSGANGGPSCSPKSGHDKFGFC